MGCDSEYAYAKVAIDYSKASVKKNRKPIIALLFTLEIGE
jgi:hypothetical protein